MIRIGITVLFLVTALAVCEPGKAQEALRDPREAFSIARQSNRNILLVFAGSDWCIPCIRFEKKILADSSFRQFAGERLVILVADFPQRSRVPDSLRTQYAALAEKYDPQGVFPQIVLLSPDRRILATLDYTGQPPAEFIRQLRPSS